MYKSEKDASIGAILAYDRGGIINKRVEWTIQYMFLILEKIKLVPELIPYKLYRNTGSY